MKTQISLLSTVFNGLLSLLTAAVLFSCVSNGQDGGMPQYPPAQVDFLQLSETTAEVEKKYPGSMEGVVNVDIKAQVSGYLEAIYVKEGDFVKKGQPLFRIKGEVFNEQVNSSEAALKTALANQASAQLELEKMKPLVEAKVVSDMQLKSAQASYDAVTAQVAQAKSAVGSSRINADFSMIKAPVSGYISRIPKRIGNLVTPGDESPLTTLSDIHTVFVYFSMSEAEYLAFMKENKSGNITNNVNLVIADGSTYEHKGSLEPASGNIDPSTASMTLKAVFPNPDKLLRSGGSARVVLKKTVSSALAVPMASVKDIQDKFFVFVLADSNKVSMRPLEIAGIAGDRYLIKSGIQAGDKIALNKIDVLNEGMPVVPKVIAPDNKGK